MTKTIKGDVYKVVVIKGVTYLRDAGGVLWRHFVTVDGSGKVIGDLEAGRENWSGVGIPGDLVDVTAHDQWDGLGSLIYCTRQEDGSFTEKPAPVVRRSLPRAHVLRLLTPQEYADLFGVEAQKDPVLAQGAAVVMSTDVIDLDDPLVDQMLGYCVQQGKMTQQRAGEFKVAMGAAAN